jgi:hypothetical protein
VTQAVLVRVRPRRSLIVTALASVVLVMLPTFGVLYWFGAENDRILLVVVVHLALIALAVLVLLRQLSIDTTVTEAELRGRGIFSPMIRVPLERVARVDLVPTYVGQAPEPTVQLLVRDAARKRVYRMRGNFWAPGDLEKVAAALPVAANVANEPIPLDEFFGAYPGSAYWFENRPLLVGTILLVAVALGVAAAAYVMTVLGVPVGFA